MKNQQELSEAKAKKRLAKLEAKTKDKYIQTYEGKQSLWGAISEIGVANKVHYFNTFEKRNGLGFKQYDKTFDWGLIFNNGFEIRHVDKSVCGLVDAPIIMRRERKV